MALRGSTQIRHARTGTLVGEATGADYLRAGFTVEIPEEIGFAVFEIRRLP